MKTKIFTMVLLVLPFLISAQVQMTIGAGVDMMIGVGASVSVGTAASSGIISNSTNGNLVVASKATGSGSLICSGTPNATVQSYIQANAWHLVTPVTTDVTSNNFFLGSPNRSWLAGFNEAKNDYYYIIKTDTTLTRGTGFSYWLRNNLVQTVEYAGKLTGVDVTIPLTKANLGWNLIGNPYPSALDWSKVSSGITTGTAYVWDNTKDGYLYTSGGTAPTPNVGTLPGKIIPMGQGFMVQATSTGNFVIPHGARVHDHTNGFLKSSQVNNSKSDTASPSMYIRIDIDGGYYGNTVFVGFPEKGTSGFDNGLDATKLFSSKTNIQFFAFEGGHQLCIDANAPLTASTGKTVPLYIVQATGKQYTMKFSELDQLPNVKITLEDLKSGKTQDIRENPVYAFTSANSDDARRFLLHFNESATGINNPGKPSEDIHIYSYGKDVFIRSTDKVASQKGEVFIYDMMGRKLLQQSISGSNLVRIPVNASSNFIVVRVVKANITTTQKVYIK